MITSAKRAAAACALLASTSSLALIATPAAAQVAGKSPAPAVRQPVDENGVDVIRGMVEVGTVDVSIGPDDHRGLRYSRTNGLGAQAAWIEQNAGTYTVVLNGRSDRFDGNLTSTEGRGATLTFASGTYTYTSPDGTVARFANNQGYQYQFYEGELARLASITYPDGTRHTFTWRLQTLCPGGYEGMCQSPLYYVVRLTSVQSSAGYQLKMEYANNATRLDDMNYEGWSTVTKVTAINNADEFCDPAAATCQLTGTWPAATYTNGPRDAIGRLIKTYVTASGGSSIGGMTSVTRDGVTYQYAYADNGNLRTTTVTDPQGRSQVYVSDIAASLVKSYRDAAGQTWTYDHDGAGRVTAITAPEGDVTRYTYDARGNVTETRVVAKPGSGLADIVTTAGYEAGCSNQKTCNKPVWTRDAKGGQTDYAYDPTHGGLTSVTLPAGANGVRPQTRYGYQQLRSYVRAAAGAAPTASGSIYMLTGSSACQTGASCAGGADEVRTIIDYGPQQNGIGNNLLPRSVTVAAGDSSVSSATSTSYDQVGDPMEVDGPLPGPSDVTRYRFNLARELVGVVGPDPDGAGSLKHRAARMTYDADRLLTAAEVGTVNSRSDADWNAFSTLQTTTTAYADRRATRSTFQAGGAIYGVTDYGYDPVGRLECTAVRMNPAAFGTTPAACSLGAQGPDGPDRIARTAYDGVGRVTSTTTAYGTPDAATEHATYTNNGRVQTAKDANGNTTSYGYDGVDRPATVTFPGGSFEQLGYDPAGNVTSRRLRDGQVIGYGYDALNRVISRDLPDQSDQPGGTNNDSVYGYDLLDRLTYASDTMAVQSGLAWLFGYDALGRRTTESLPFNGTFTTSYDAAGRRTRVTWPDGFFVAYEYDQTGAMTVVRENGGFALASFGYDDLGRRTSLSRGNGTVTSYGYDAASRLSSLTQDIAGGAHDVNVGFGYNPAGQITSRSSSNGAYAFAGHYNVNRGYQVNGLNQYTQAGGTALAYDGRGNLTQSGSNSYGYNSRNMMNRIPGGGHIYNTPLDQLFDVSTETQWLMRSGDELLTEIGYDGQWRRRYVHGPGTDEPLVWYEGSGTGDRRWLHGDERGSVVAVTNGSGQAIAVNTYDEHGVPGAGNIGRFQYTGQKWLSTLGLYDYKARMYSPMLGRFMQTDPIGYADGMNWYDYVGGDPVNKVDPTGMDADLRKNYKLDQGQVPRIETSIDVFGKRGPPIMWGDKLGMIVFNGPVAGFAKEIEGATVSAAPQSEKVACNQRVRVANSLLSWADGADANGDTAIKAGGIAAGGAVLATATGVGAPGGGLLGTFALGSFTAGTLAKAGASFVRLVGHTVGGLATGNRQALQNAFMNGVLAGATSGRGGPAGSIAEGAMGDAAKQPVPNSYSCPR